MTTIAEYRRRVLERHKAAFAFYGEVAALLEGHIVTPKKRTGVVRLALDMLLIQSSKTHASVALLAQHGLMEDTATLARRLLELSVQCVYISAEDDPVMRERKAGRFIAFMWRQLPPKLKHRLPTHVREHWSQLARRYGRFIRKNANTWGPSWSVMFTEIGSENLYLRDYRFLSGIAHGRSDHQIFQFSMNPVPVHSDNFVSILVIWATRYYIVAATEWNRQFKQIADDELDRLVHIAAAWKYDVPSTPPESPEKSVETK